MFVTCIIDQFYPNVGESIVRVLRRLGVDVDFPASQTCCGQPAFNSGFWKEAKPLAKRFLSQFRGENYVVVPSGSCASMIRVFYAELLHDEPELLQQLNSITPRVYEFSEFVVDVLGITDLSEYAVAIGADDCKVTYHDACHLTRELGAATQARTLINSLPGVDLVEMEQAEVCCGFGGTFSVKYPEISGAMLQDKIDNVKRTGAESLVACDNSCLMHISGGLDKQGIGVQTMHLAQLLDRYMNG